MFKSKIQKQLDELDIAAQYYYFNAIAHIGERRIKKLEEETINQELDDIARITFKHSKAQSLTHADIDKLGLAAIWLDFCKTIEDVHYQIIQIDVLWTLDLDSENSNIPLINMHKLNIAKSRIFLKQIELSLDNFISTRNSQKSS